MKTIYIFAHTPSPIDWLVLMLDLMIIQYQKPWKLEVKVTIFLFYALASVLFTFTTFLFIPAMTGEAQGRL